MGGWHVWDGADGTVLGAEGNEGYRDVGDVMGKETAKEGPVQLPW